MIDKDVQIALLANLPAILTALSAAGVGNAIATWWAARRAKEARDETRTGNKVLADTHAAVKAISDQSMTPAGAAAAGAAVAIVASEQAHSEGDTRLAEAQARIKALEDENAKLKSDHERRHATKH